MYPQEEINPLLNVQVDKTQQGKERRVLIDYKSGYYWHYITTDKYDHVTRPIVKMKRDLISVGCTDITPKALGELLDRYDILYAGADKEVIIQTGNSQ